MLFHYFLMTCSEFGIPWRNWLKEIRTRPLFIHILLYFNESFNVQFEKSLNKEGKKTEENSYEDWYKPISSRHFARIGNPDFLVPVPPLISSIAELSFLYLDLDLYKFYVIQSKRQFWLWNKKDYYAAVVPKDHLEVNINITVNVYDWMWLLIFWHS